ncbi:hypothetical protein B0T09DRAFT_105495 [Sordaria sp. MPI-SDFR-AT-0083]|nr:hypothetical protein B0T09DRAFT_105495 [Sordaria sp. MPI-SDFR-AT-0083]
MVYSVPRKAAGLMLAVAGARVLATDCGLDSWECAPSYSAVPACATAAIESAALVAGCPHGDYKCECSKKEELQGMIFDEVVANCGLLGGLDVVKAVSYLCDCDATASTFTACPTVAPSSTISEPPVITEPPATPTDCGLDSWECAPLYSSVPACATAAIESAALEAGCAHGDYKCECSKKEELQGMIFDEVVANCGLLGGLDVVKAVSYLCDCDATATTFEPCASATVVPSSTANSEAPIITSAPVVPSGEPSSQPPITITTTSSPVQPSGNPTGPCGEESWACAPEYAAVPVCAVDIIANAGVSLGCAAGDHKCECSKSAEIQEVVFDDVIASCGLLGGLDVIKAVTALCECDAAKPTFKPCDGNAGPSSSVPIPSGGGSTTIITTDIVTSDCSTSTSGPVVIPSTTVVPGPEPSGPCGEESWACAPEYAAVPVCAVDIIANAGVSLGCAAGDHKCECSKSAEIQEVVFDDVIASCGLLGGLDVIKAVTALCECDAAKPTFKPCDGNAGPSSSVPIPSGGGSTTIITTDIVTSDCSTSTSGPVVIPSTTVVPGPEPSGPCGEESWACAPEYAAVPVCAVDIIANAGVSLGCAAGDHKCECSKSAEIQEVVFDDVIASCGLLGGLDVIKAVTALCECDAAKPTFKPCDGNAGPSSSVPIPSGGGSTTIITTDIVTSDCSTSTSGPVVIPSSTVVPGPEPSGPCGEESWACAPEYAAVPVCAVDIIANAGVSLGCAAGDHKCECSKSAEIQEVVFDDVIASCGLLGGLDVIKAVTALCECDAAKPTFKPCDGNAGPSSSVPIPSGGGSTTIITTDIVTSDCSTSTSGPVVIPSTTVVPGPEPSGPCGEESWACAPEYAAVPVCAVDIIANAGVSLGCAAGDHKCECSKSAEIQEVVFDDVIASCGLLGGLDVIKAVTALCECDAAKPTFKPCDGNAGPSSSVPIPSGGGSTTIITTDIVTSDCSTSTSGPVVIPSSTVVPGPEPSGPCGEESWACAPEYAAVPVCAVDIIANAGVSLGCAAGDHKCECSKSAEIQEVVFDDVIASCGLLGGLDVIKAVTALCECDAAKPTFKPCDGNAGPSSSVPIPSGGGSTTIITTDIVTSDCSTSTSGPVVIPSSTVVPGPEPSGPCGEESWGCAAEFAAVPQCAVPIIEKAALALGCAKGDHKCECANAEKIQGAIALDVLSACGASKITDVLSSVEALCKCDAAKPTFTPCGGSSGPGPTASNPVTDSPSPGPSSVVVVPSSVITSSPGTQPSGTVPEGPCGIDSWECAPLFSAVPACAVPIIQKAALDLGCAEGDHKCECSNAEKIQGAIALDVLSACGAAKVTDVLSSVEALCKCDSAKPTFTECGSNPGPTDGNGGGPGPSTSASGGGSNPGPTGGNGGGSNPGPSTSASGGGSNPGPTGGNGGGSNPGPTGGNGGGSGPGPAPSTTDAGDCPAVTDVPAQGPCGEDSWECAEEFKAIPECAVGFIETAAVSVGCKKGDHACECKNKKEIQGLVFDDVLSGCGVTKGAQVIAAVEALCACDASAPTFTACGAVAQPTGGCSGGSPGGGGSGGSSSSSFVTVTHSTIITSAGPTGGNGGGSGSGPTGGNGGGGSGSGPTSGNDGGGSGGSGPSSSAPGGGSGGSGPSGTGGSDVPVPSPSDAIPPPPVTGGASKMMASTGCVALMAALFAVLL